MRRALWLTLLSMTLALPAAAAERELDEDVPPDSILDILNPIERVFRPIAVREPLFPWLREQIEDLPAFFSDSVFEARYRTYYFRTDKLDDTVNEAWAMGGSLYYRSGWLADVFATEVEGFTSQKIIGENSKPGTLLLAEPDQDSISVVGIANAKLRYASLLLTGGRHYLDLPYINRQDNRMIPNTFEGITLARPEGKVQFSTGYSWNVKLRDSDDFESFSKAVDAGRNRGLWHGGVLWSPNEAFEVGTIAAGVPDLFWGIYAEGSYVVELDNGLGLRLDSQFTYQDDHGDDLLKKAFDRSWNLGIRGSASFRAIVGRIGFVATGDSTVGSLYGTNPSYVDLMQRTFTAEDEKALLLSLSYDFAEIGLTGLTAIANFVAGFNGERSDRTRDSQELDLTVDYRVRDGWFRNLWLRARGSWLHEDGAKQDAWQTRIILRYDFPVI